MMKLLTAHRLWCQKPFLIPVATSRSKGLFLVLQKQILRYSRVNWLAWVLQWWGKNQPYLLVTPGPLLFHKAMLLGAVGRKRTEFSADM